MTANTPNYESKTIPVSSEKNSKDVSAVSQTTIDKSPESVKKSLVKTSSHLESSPSFSNKSSHLIRKKLKSNDDSLLSGKASPKPNQVPIKELNDDEQRKHKKIVEKKLKYINSNELNNVI